MQRVGASLSLSLSLPLCLSVSLSSSPPLPTDAALTKQECYILHGILKGETVHLR